MPKSILPKALQEYCFVPLELKSSSTSGYLHSSNFIQAIPVVNGMILFNEIDLLFKDIVEARVSKLVEELEETTPLYQQFIRQKARRPVYDIYACFQPFNEATKSLYPFLNLLKKHLKKGDTILNLWDRTGWLGGLLAGFFPEQQVISIWEGNKDVLGYKGFHHWYGQDCPDNLWIMFADLNKPLPFPENSIAATIGLDTFHRFDQSHLIQELHKCVREDGFILFPHVHLTNAEPEPYFDRGCRQLHGTTYQRFFNHFTQRKGYIFSEPGLFWLNEKGVTKALVSEPDSTDFYNALLALLPNQLVETQLYPMKMEGLFEQESHHILVNPLLYINWQEQRLEIDYQRFEGVVGYLLERHPIYIKRLAGLDHLALDETSIQLLYLANQAFSIGKISKKLKLPLAEIISILQHLQALDILQVVPVTQTFLRLQQFISLQTYILAEKEQNLATLWQQAIQKFAHHPLVISESDESEFTYSDSAEIVQSIEAQLLIDGLKQGDRIVFLGALHTEAIFTFWAAINLGIVLVPIVKDQTTQKVAYILSETQPTKIFTTYSAYQFYQSEINQYPIIVFDEEEEKELRTKNQWFAEWLETEIQEQPPLILQPEDLAVILYTSGSTGEPKGVMLSHGNLTRSGRLITETFHWTAKDKIFALGDLASMSGLRNTVIAPLEVGASIIVPDVNKTQQVFGIAESIGAQQATILATNPALLRQLFIHKKRVRGDLTNLRQVMCTGSPLHNTLRQDFQAAFQLSILNYYGLTETTGICTSESPQQLITPTLGIGKAINSIIQVVNEQEEVLSTGQIGELRIYSLNIMQGYYQRPDLTAQVIKNGWFYTGDLALIHPDGTIELKGRKRQIIKTAQDELVYPLEIEQQLLQLKQLVKEVATTTFQENDAEKIAVFIVPQQKPEEATHFKNEIRAYLLAQIGSRKMPSLIKLVDKIPVTANGKIHNKVLLKILMD